MRSSRTPLTQKQRQRAHIALFLCFNGLKSVVNTFKKNVFNIFVFMFELIYLYYHNSLSNSDSWTVNFEVSALWTYVDYVSSQKDSWAETFLFWVCHFCLYAENGGILLRGQTAVLKNHDHAHSNVTWARACCYSRVCLHTRVMHVTAVIQIMKTYCRKQCILRHHKINDRAQHESIDF